MALYLADTSAWNRANATPTIAERWAERLLANEIAVCPPVALELLYSARGPSDYSALRDELAGLPSLLLSQQAVERAAATQAALATRGQHRGPRPMDLLIAAVAEMHEAVLLHYDRHFEAIAQHTGQSTEWLAGAGSVP